MKKEYSVPELESLFEKASIPGLKELSGTYDVLMVSGFFIFLNLLKDQKIIFVNHWGYNLARKTRWGNFFLKEREEALLIDYNVSRNIFTTGIVDYIRRVKENEYLGRFTWTFLGHEFFLGYFFLTKVKQNAAKRL